ncbi:SpoIIE family protein phosphatase [Allosphingosinicella flava]|uniref:SpoIIE family protein phosphatase n=1 Tax=Allosphingosinicella flava TaxID=2771430 RepID=A0A7T2GJM4_9SPHN|nr:SpoIIE family protein phosphatase [Sphingosinicella flava]QPQ54977.1 SpoIIE family protein phosphatase [Sphingosinicella flava]
MDQPAAPVRIDRALSVLVVDDDELVRGFVAIILEGLGCIVEDAADGEAALALLRSRHFDVLITDWQMPGLDGLDLVSRVRAETAESYLHIIMMTARGDEQTVRDALRVGVDDFLQKPVDQLQLELGIASARRVVDLQRRLMRRNRHLAAANARTREAYRRIKSDLAAAADLQRKLLPEPCLDGPFRYAWHVDASLEIGGDTLSVLPVSGDRLLFFHLDVSGHGIPAALGSFSVHERILRLAFFEPERLPEAAVLLNHELLALGGESYLTMVLGVADARTGEVWFIRAGHPHPLLIRQDGEACWFTDGGLPIGLLPDITHPVTRVHLEPGDRILFYSDGLTDSAGNDGEVFGEEGLEELARASTGLPLSAFLTRLDATLTAQRGNTPPEDDISILVLERAAETEV